jgi:hypothetical protein
MPCFTFSIVKLKICSTSERPNVQVIEKLDEDLSEYPPTRDENAAYEQEVAPGRRCMPGVWQVLWRGNMEIDEDVVENEQKHTTNEYLK